MAKKEDKNAVQAKIAAEAKNSAEARKDALLDVEAKDSPVLLVLAKRLRAAKKKAKRADEIDAIKASGKEINADQEEALRGKAKNLANVEELERLVPLLREAVREEVSLAVAKRTEELEAAAAAAAAAASAEEAKAAAEASDIESAKASALAEDLESKAKEAAERAAAEATDKAEAEAQKAADVARLTEDGGPALTEAVTRLLQLIYFSKLFSTGEHSSPDSQHGRAYVSQLERDACISYDGTVEFDSEPLSHKDLDLIAKMGKLVTTRAENKEISHKAAIEECKRLALMWINASDEPLPEINNLTVEELVVRFERIIASSYYTIIPQIRPVSQELAEQSVLGPDTFHQEAPLSSMASQDAAQFPPHDPFGTQGGPSTEHTFQHLLNQRPHQVTSEAPPADQPSLTNGFAPSLLPGGYEAGMQPPGFETLEAALPEGIPLGEQDRPFFNVFPQQQPSSFANNSGMIAPPSANGQYFTGTEAIPADASSSAPPPEDANGFFNKGAAGYGSAGGPRRDPRSEGRGRGPGRGRGGAPGRTGDFGPRGGSRGGRGPRARGGRGRESPIYPPTQFGQGPAPGNPGWGPNPSQQLTFGQL